MARPPGGGLLGRLLSGVLGRGSRPEGSDPAAEERREAAQRLEAAQQRLRQEIPPPEEPPPPEEIPPPEEPPPPDSGRQ